MAELDDDVGELLDLIEELGVADNTFIMFTTDNGAASNSWPDGGNQQFKGEKGAGGWEGGFRVPILWDVDECSPKLDRETLYVGLSRAKSILYVCGSKEANQRILG